MKKIIVTQRVVHDSITGETRDCLDQRWIIFLKECKLLPLIIPNNIGFKEFIHNNKFDGILLTGGNNLMSYNGDAEKRDLLEKKLLKHAIKTKIPLVGVCRGMQIIQDFFDVKLTKIKNHVTDEMEIFYNKKKRIVNSFHEYGTKENNKNFKIIAYSYDKIVKGIKHNNLPIFGMMWHPERNISIDVLDVKVFEEIFIE